VPGACNACKPSAKLLMCQKAAAALAAQRSFISRQLRVMINHQEAMDMAKQIGAIAYRECSALTREGLKEIFDEAIASTLGGQKKPGGSSRKKCRLL